MPESVDKYFSPANSNVFALVNLPEVVKGALFSRYSRSPDNLREILEQEFLVLGEEKAEAFYDRVLGEYGDDSVAELGGCHIAIEGVSDLVAQEILSSRIGISPLAKSTRYVDFGKDASPYYTPEAIVTDQSARQIYDQAMRLLYDTYNGLLPRVVEQLKLASPRDGVSPAAYDRSVKAKALDLIRGLLPIGTRTNLGLFGNGRAFEYLIVKLNASDHPEAHEIAKKIKIALDGVIAPFVKRSTAERGRLYTDYLRRLRLAGTKALPDRLPDPFANFFCAWDSPREVELIKYNRAAADEVLIGTIYPLSNDSHGDIQNYVQSLSDQEKIEILDNLANQRSSRHQRPGRALELADYLFEITSDIGAYRDLHRHRICTEIRQQQGFSLSYDMPAGLAALGCGISEDYKLALDSAKISFKVLTKRGLDCSADYLLPMAYNCRWLHKLNLREAVHLVELRSQPQGHISYREVAWAMADLIIQANPLLASQFRFVDRTTEDLGRLKAEVRTEEKQLEQKKNN